MREEPMPVRKERTTLKSKELVKAWNCQSFFKLIAGADSAEY
jgi:hypothetical protein